LPSATDDNSAYGTLIVARDESGSMSDAECAKAAGIIADAKNYYKKIIVLKHDTKISSINEFEELDENARKMLLTRDSCGGTSHKEIFEWINEYDKKHIDENRISCCIFITDMYSDIENYQHIIKHLPKIYLTTPNSAENYDKKVEGVLIPIEE
jgi:predicted metal-dependent peptidase